MNLYDRLLNKEGFEALGKETPKSYERTIEVLKNNTTIHELNLFEACELFWILYPDEVFDMTKFFHLFELAD